MAERNQHEDQNAIAIVGMAGRFPGAASLDQFWENIRDGRVSLTIGDVDTVDKKDCPDKLVNRGFCIDNPYGFDADFFGLSPAEAELTDPQHRIFLECAWEALQSAGYDPSDNNLRIGLFAGCSESTYMMCNVLPSRGFKSSILDIPMMIANEKDYLCTRTSYMLNLKGPSVGIQTACSSSLVAVHMARQALLNNECDIALAGGITVRSPQIVEYRPIKNGYLSNDGMCRPFDAQASGTLFGNGAGLVVLRKLDEAQANRDKIEALVVGSAINNDGSAKIGFTAPSVTSQTEVIKQALASGEIDPATVSYVETHGTGTPLGDPIEITALKAALGNNPQNSCTLGSTKANIGHLEVAAGVTGLIKTAMALNKKTLPPIANYTRPNSALKLENSPFTIGQEASKWYSDEVPRRAGVSSFGIGGTNAHVVLEEWVDHERADRTTAYCDALLDGKTLPYSITARDSNSLEDAMRMHLEFLKEHGSDFEFSDLCSSLLVRAHQHSHRACITASDYQEVIVSLQNYLNAGQDRRLKIGYAKPGQKNKLIFVFPGQGPNWLAKAQELYSKNKVFHDVINQCDSAVRDQADWSLKNIYCTSDNASDNQSRLPTRVEQVALFAFQIALAELWKSLGITPTAVLGHSMGEVAAAYTCGGLSMESAVQVIIKRAELLGTAMNTGAMLATDLSHDEALAVIAGDTASVGIAAHNGPSATVLSGKTKVIDRIKSDLEQRNRFCREIRTNGVPGHSQIVEPLAIRLSQDLKSLATQQSSIEMHSTVHADVVSGEQLNGDYWAKNLRDTVQFYPTIEQLAKEDKPIFLEITPQPTLTMALFESLQHLDSDGICIAALQRDEGVEESLVSALRELHVDGIEFDRSEIFPELAQFVRTPLYPWQRKKYKMEAATSSSKVRFEKVAKQSTVHQLFDEHFQSCRSPFSHHWQLNQTKLKNYADEHVVFEFSVLPATAYIHCVHEAVAQNLGLKKINLNSIVFVAPLFLRDVETANIQLSVNKTGIGQWDFVISSQQKSGGSWKCHARGNIEKNDGLAVNDVIRESAESSPRASLCGEDFYATVQEMGVQYGSSFSGLQAIWKDGGEVFSKLELPTNTDWAHLLDVGFQTVLAGCLIDSNSKHPTLYIPASLDSIELAEDFPKSCICRVKIVKDRRDLNGSLLADIDISSFEGKKIAEIRGLEITRIDRKYTALSESDNLSEGYQIHWQKSSTLAAKPQLEPGQDWLVLVDDSLLSRQLVGTLKMLKQHVQCVSYSAEINNLAVPVDYLNPIDKKACNQYFKEYIEAHPKCRGIINLWALQSMTDSGKFTRIYKSIERSCSSTLHLAQYLHTLAQDKCPPLILITEGAHSVRPKDSANPSQATLIGFGRTLQIEMPEIECTLFDLDPTFENDIDQVVSLIGDKHRLPEFALRDKNVYTPLLRTTAINQFHSDQTELIRASATYLIAGGLGGLGLSIAEQLVATGVTNLLLLGRNAVTEEARHFTDRLREKGIKVGVAVCDITQREKLSQAIDQASQYLPPIAGVIQCAGHLEDGLIINQDWSRFSEALRPKITGTENLRHCTKAMNLDFFVFFSSVSSVLGSIGQSNHAAANAYMDAVAFERNAQGLPALSINWGPWSEVGRASEEAVATELARKGLPGISTRAAWDAFSKLIKSSFAQIGLFRLNIEDWVAAHRSAKNDPKFHALLSRSEKSNRSTKQTGTKSNAITNLIPGRPRTKAIEDNIVKQLSAILGFEADRISVDTEFQTMGMDSLRALQLRDQIEQTLNIKLASTIVWKYHNISELAAHIESVLQSQGKTQKELEKEST